MNPFLQFYVIAYNSVGKGDPSHAIAVKTKGSGIHSIDLLTV